MTVGLGTSVLIAGVVWLTVTVARGELGTGDQLASVISAYIGICGLAATVVGTVISARRNRGAAEVDGGSHLALHARPPFVSAVYSSSDDRGARDDISVVPAVPDRADSQGVTRVGPSGKQAPEAQQLHSRADSVPHQLPGAPRLFTGRVRELARLTAVLDSAKQGATVVISAIGGAGGIGKTWLAVHWAHQNIKRFPDGQLYVNLRGFDPSGSPMPPGVAVRDFLDALGVDPAAVPVDLDAQAGLYRSLVTGKRMLMVLDNARDTAQVAPLLPGDPACTVVVTSRHQLTGLVTAHGALLVDLDVLSEVEARELLVRHLGYDRITAEPEAVAELLERCGGVPLALGIVAARSAAHPDFPLSVLVEELREASARLDALDAGELRVNLRAVFSWSYQALDAETAKVFGLLGLAPGPDISLAAAASLVGHPVTRTRSLLRDLETAYLVRQHAPGRYRLHDLICLYAAERAQDELPQDARDAALRRLIDFYIHTAHAGDQLLHSHRQPIEPIPLDTSCRPYPLKDTADVMAWFIAEHSSLLAAQRLAAENSWNTQVWHLAWILDSFHRRRNLLSDYFAVSWAGLAAAQRLNDPTARAQIHRSLGDAYSRAGEYAKARDHLGQALTLAEQTEDVLSQFHTLHVLAWSWELQDADHQALIHATDSLQLAKKLDNPLPKADALRQMGWYHVRLGHYNHARSYCEAALAVYLQCGDREHEAHVLHELGYLAHRTGNHTQAVGYYRDAIALFRARGNTYWQAILLDYLAESHAILGQHGEARDAWQQAVDLYRAQHRITDADRVEQQLAALDKHIS